MKKILFLEFFLCIAPVSAMDKIIDTVDYSEIEKLQDFIETEGIDAQDGDGNTLLRTAINNQCGPEMLQFLIDNKADVNQPAKNKPPVIFECLMNNNMNALRTLIDNKADINTTKGDKTVIDYYFDYRKRPVLTIRAAPVSVDNSMSLVNSVTENCIEIPRLSSVTEEATKDLVSAKSDNIQSRISQFAPLFWMARTGSVIGFNDSDALDNIAELFTSKEVKVSNKNKAKLQTCIDDIEKNPPKKIVVYKNGLLQNLLPFIRVRDVALIVESYITSGPAFGLVCELNSARAQELIDGRESRLALVRSAIQRKKSKYTVSAVRSAREQRFATLGPKSSFWHK